jgi:hypothetical protein
MNPFVDYKPDLSYWDIDPQLKVIAPFKSLYSNDKSKKKVNSSQMMWAVAFFTHPQSRLDKFSTVEKWEVIEEDIITFKEYNRKELTVPIKMYKKMFLTQAQRSLFNWREKLEERDAYLISIPYKELELTEAEKLDKLLAGTPKLYQQYEAILDSIQEEESKGRTKGGRAESASEKGEM